MCPQVEVFVAPKQESIQAVKDWLNENDISPSYTSPAGDIVKINVTIDQANTLLKANYTAFTYEATNTTMMRTLAYSLPVTDSPCYFALLFCSQSSRWFSHHVSFYAHRRTRSLLSSRQSPQCTVPF